MLGRSSLDDPSDPSDDPVPESAPDQSGSGYFSLGAGLCRGPNWQIGKIWPKFEGLETTEECFKECEKDSGCTAFDVSPSEVKNKYRCVLFGHSTVEVANSASLRVSRCYKMKGRSAGSEGKAFV